MEGDEPAALPTPVKTARLTWLLNRGDQPMHGYQVDPLHTWNAAQPEVDRANRRNPVSTGWLLLALVGATALLVLVVVALSKLPGVH